MFNHSINAAAARSLMQLRSQLIQPLRITRSNNLNITRIGILDPTTQPKLGGFAVDEPAEAHALYTAANEEVEDHGYLATPATYTRLPPYPRESARPH